MTSVELLADASERDQALDIERSFIMQAPAGSGKTGVLTQRILKLLAVVERPEQILAITFTKKAAAEMRHRVMSALQNAAADVPPENEHDQLYDQLARQVLQRDRQRQWNLLDNPGRLRLQTIDSLCSSIVRDNPLAARLGVQFNVADDASDCYSEAARSLLASLDEDSDLGRALYRVLGFLDSQYRKLNQLIGQMLAQRDHWLHDVAASQHNWDGFRELMRCSLERINEEAEMHLRELAGPQLCREMAELTIYASNQLHFEKPDHALLQTQPGSIAHRKQQWNLFLTQNRTIRSRADKTWGFPAETHFSSKAEKELAKAYKQRVQAVLQTLSAQETTLLPLVLDFINAPPPELDDQEWQLLSDLVLVLYYAAAHLKLVFQQRKTVDFSEIALAALDTLGNPDQPGEAALALDERIQHILVDEFQDTSFIQVNLLEKLSAGWTPGDGRTLFLVGDPMQSIYAFRKADVGLFLRLWQQNLLGNVSVESLQLRMNFRSSPAVLDWVNAHFRQIFPERDDARLGAVTFAHSQAGKIRKEGDATSAQLFIARDDVSAAAQAEAQWIAQRILALEPGQSVAVLVKSKSHIAWIAQAFRQHDIAYQAVDIEKLNDSQIIQDLLSVYRAYLAPGDKVAWFALLRGPWCGLTLKELQLVAAADAHPWRALEKLVTAPQTDELDAEMRARIDHIHATFQRAYQQRYQQPFAEALRELVLQLGIPSTANSDEEVNAIELFFSMLTEVEETASTPTPDAIGTRLEKLFVPAAPPQTGKSMVQIMTMHKSKGLEFDVVFLPQLHRTGQADDKPLILVDKQTAVLDDVQEIFMAPRPNTDTARSDSVYSFLWKQKQQRTKNEAVRLLYVACTRARKQLHLSACLTEDDKQQVRKPRSGSLLAVIWPVLEQDAERHPIEQAPTPATHRSLRRLPLLPATGAVASAASATSGLTTAITAAETEESSQYRRHAGTLVHKLFEQWVRFPAFISTTISDTVRERWRIQLQALSVDDAGLDPALDIVTRAVSTVARNTGRMEWLFTQPHDQSSAEFRLSVQIDGQPQHLTIDRTFVHAGTRYIIDYKLSEPDADPVAFLTSETEKYRPQLQAYRQALAAQENLPARLYLYFPLLDHLQEIED